MALVIRDPTDTLFVGSLLDALSAMAPAFLFWVGKDGTVARSPPNCGTYLLYRAGCNLAAAIVDHDRTVLVQRSTSKWGNSFRPGNDEVAPLMSWFPDRVDTLETNACQTGDAPGAVALAHELSHAYRELYEPPLSGLKANEIYACEAENMIRAELCEPSRVAYGPDTGEDPTRISGKGGIPAHDRFRCTEKSAALPDPVRLDCGERINSLCAIYQLGPKRTREVGGHEIDRSFITVVPELEEQYYLAYLNRAASEDYRAANEWLRRPGVAPPEATIRIESAGLAGGFGFVVIELRPSRLIVTTNMQFNAGEVLYAQTHAPPVAHSVGLDRRAEVMLFLDRWYPPSLDDGGPPDQGGTAETFDGTAELLSISRADRVGPVQVGLYGYTFPAFSGFYEEPAGDDAQRWRAIEEAYRLTQTLVTGAPETRQVPNTG